MDLDKKLGEDPDAAPDHIRKLEIEDLAPEELGPRLIKVLEQEGYRVNLGGCGYEEKTYRVEAFWHSDSDSMAPNLIGFGLNPLSALPFDEGERIRLRLEVREKEGRLDITLKHTSVRDYLNIRKMNPDPWSGVEELVRKREEDLIGALKDEFTDIREIS